MKTNPPSHEEVSQRAQELWKTQGCPSGRDDQIWLEAERQLAAETSAPGDAGGSQERGHGKSQASVTGGPATSVDPKPPGESTEQPASTPIEAAAQTTQQKKAARAPKSPTKTAPKPAPAETGKPLWKRPHSS